jgi:hypothetical protein
MVIVMNKKYNSFIDYFKISIGGIAFLAIILLSIWATSLIIEPDPNLDTEAFMAQMITRGLLTIMLVSSGVNLAYDITKLIIISIGSRSYSAGSATTTPGYKYIEAQEEISLAKSIIDRHGLILELEETVDYINLERKIDSYENMIDREIEKLTRESQKKRNARDAEKVKEYRSKISEVKHRKSIIAKFRTSITKFDRMACIDYDEKLSEIYGEPKYDIVYSKDIYHMKAQNRNTIEKIMNSSIFFFLRERVQPVISPLIFAGVLTYYIVSFNASANNIALLLTVGVTTLMAMGNAILREIKVRFSRINVSPVEDNAYVFKKFRAKHGTLIKVLDEGTLSIDEYHELQKHKMENLKKKMDEMTSS